MPDINVNVVLTPDKPISDTAISVSEKLSSLDSLFTLKSGDYYPHVSIYMVRINESSLQDVLNAVEEIANLTPALTFKATKYNETQGYLDAEYYRSQEIRKI